MTGTKRSSNSPLAAVDIGSNSFRLEVGDMVHGRYRRLDYLKEVVRLGAGLDENADLTEDAAGRGLAALGRFSARLAGMAPPRVRAVATQTLREARNRDAFLERAEQALGIPVEIISGREEARLIYAGVAHLQPSTRRRLVIDIGGRSTELILGEGSAPLDAESFQVGSVSLSMRYFGDGQLTSAAFRAAQVAAGAELEEAFARFRPQRWEEVLGASGTVGAVSQLLAASQVTDGRLTVAGLAWCIERCLEAGHVDALRLPDLKDERKPVLAGGLSILYTLLASFGIDEMQPAKGALRHGVIVDLAGRLEGLGQARAEDVRQRSVLELQRRFGVELDQAERVRAAALSKYASIAAAEDLEHRLELGWACDLHEAGMIVSHHDYHRHGAYIVACVDAPGFSQSQQRRIGDLVLGQRGGLRKLGAALASETYLWQVLCLRLAVIECHARAPIGTSALDVERSGHTARLRFSAAWAAEHPRTLHLLRQEAELWNRGEALRLDLSAT